MSKIFVDQVDPKTGTSLTLGTSGDTVNIPSGVTIANAGTATGFGVSLANGADNRVVTASSASALNGEANLTFDGTALTANKVILTNSSSLTGGASSDGFITNADDTNTGIVFPDSDRIQFWTNDAERMRILSDGTITISTTGTIPSNSGGIHVLRGNGQNGTIGYFRSDSTSYDANIINTECSATSTNSTFNFYRSSNGNGTGQFFVRDSGNVQNTNNSYGSSSDERIKQDITDASSQWDDIKAIKVRSYKLKSDPTKTQLGVVAQELETANMNGLVEEIKPEKTDVAYHSDFGTLEDDTTKPILDEDGNETGAYEQIFTEGQKVKSVKYSVLYMKAIKALQESMERIETLEAKVTALENA